ncbi:Txe/YoeB family addiction module toxin [bacterium]|nr:Txe/YoeB family addiction module toxin [bacterium]MBU1613747.1 Txe/YoeB family addiction module toxin [bacterium]
MIWSINILEQAEEDLEWYREHDRRRYVKCFDLIRSIAKNPREGIGKPERLKYFKEKGVWSRRVSQEDRIIYTVYQKEYEVDISSCKGHY